MILGLIAGALAAPSFEASVRAGGRSAPESAIQLPALWEAEIEPAALLSAELRARVGEDAGPWAQAALGGWAYGPEAEASLASAGLEVGWRAQAGESTLSAVGRYDAQLLPLLPDASNGRAELYGSARRGFGKSTLTFNLTGIDRRFIGDAGYSTAELGGVYGLSPGAWGLEIGASAQGNRALGGAVGAQGRSLLRARVGGESWRLSLEHQLLLATAGEAEREIQPAFTPVGDYAGDVDALSGGGFLQNRVGLSGAWLSGPWTLSAGAMLRLRSAASDEEAAVSFRSASSAQARVQRALRPGLDLSVVGGVAGARLGTGEGFVDAFGWLGFDLRLPQR